MVYFFTIPMRGCIGASSSGISLSLVTCKGNAGKEVMRESGKYFACSSEASFEDCAFCIKGSSLWSKVVFAVIRTGSKGIFDFCKGSNTTVKVRTEELIKIIVQSFIGFAEEYLRFIKQGGL